MTRSSFLVFLLTFAWLGLCYCVPNDASGYNNVTVGESGSGDNTDDAECSQVKHCNSTEACVFVNATSDCKNEEGFINYMFVIYCTFGYSYVTPAIIVLLLWWLILFVALATCADDFFCPPLVVIARTLHLSDNIAGVTLVAFGNGAPDVFSAISAVRGAKRGDVGLALGALLGAGVFVTTVVVGALCVVGPFQAAQRPFLRDVIFYIGAVFFTFYVVYDGKITLTESILFLVLYVVYVVVVVVGRIVYQWMRSRASPGVTMLNDDVPVSDDEDEEPDWRVVHHHLHRVTDHDDYRVSAASTYTRMTDQSPLIDSDEVLIQSTTHQSIVKDFFSALNPVTDWAESGILGKIFIIFKVPVLITLRLTVPVVDDSCKKQGWCRPLNTLHCLITPLVSLLLARPSVAVVMVGGVFPVWVIVLICCLPLAILVFFTSKNDTPPVYHCVFAYVGFVGAILWIQAIANEIVNILQAFGIVWGITEAILGLTFLAWGNSIGDLVADTAMARQGRSRIGLSACFGGPLFNLLLGVGIPFTMVIAEEGGGNVVIEQSTIQLVLVGGLLASLLSSLIVPTSLRFSFTRPYGLYLFFLYAAFLTIAILVETDVIHGVFGNN